MQHSTLAIAVLVVLVAWRVLARVRRLVGRQRSRLWRHRATVLVFPFLVGLLIVGALGEPAALWALGGGTAVGSVLAVVGFRRTRFEVTPGGDFFYTPCAPIGIGMAALLLARIGYHGLQLLVARGAGTVGDRAYTLTPTTLFVFAALSSYYGAYAFGLLRWRSRAGRG